MTHLVARHACKSRAGGVYIFVLGTCLIASIMAVGALLAGRAQARAVGLSNDTAGAQLAARSGLELARLWINNDANWRSTRVNGTWTSNLNIGSAAVTIEGVDPIDGILSNRPYDPLVLTCTATSGQSTQAMSVTLIASPTPLPSLAYAIHSAGQLHINRGPLRLGTAGVSTNADLRNDNTVEGDCTAATLNPKGIVFGTTLTSVVARANPSGSVVSAYTSLGTLISPGSRIEKVVLSPGVNPYGTPNADGVYVVRTTSDLTVQDCRINGTLVVSCPGKKVTLDHQVLMQSARPDYPVLIVNGDLEIKFDSASQVSESALNVNLNPVGAAYAGGTDSDQTDSYPSEVNGLIHATGIVTWSASGTIRGAILSESTAASDAVKVDAANTLLYDRTLFTSPPQFYTTAVKMIPQANSIKQVVR